MGVCVGVRGYMLEGCGWVGVWCVCVLVYVGVRGYMYVHVWEGGG